MWKKVAAGIIVVGSVLISVGGGVAWRHLNERLNSPRFKESLQEQISKALDGRMVFQSLKGRLGIHPWVCVENISYAGANGDLRGTANELRVRVKVLPLLRREVVFSEIAFIEPKLRLRRRSDGSWPVLPSFQGTSGESGGDLTYRIDRLTVKDAVVDLVDESRRGLPSLRMTVSLSFSRGYGEDAIDVRGEGTITGGGGTGALSLDGRLGKDTDLRLKATRIPLGVADPFFPPLSSWRGWSDLTATFSDHGGDRRWDVQGNMRDLQHEPTQTSLPLRIAWDVRSPLSSTVRAVWVSTASQVEAQVTLPDARKNDLILRVKGTDLDAREFASLASLLPSPSTAPSAKSAPWNVDARVDLEKVSWSPWSAQHLSVAIDGNPSRGKLSRFQCEGYGSTVSVVGVWGSSSVPKGVLALTGAVTSDRGEGTLEYQSSIKLKPIRDFLFDPSTRWGVDVHVSSAEWKGVPIVGMNGHFSYGSDGVFRAEGVEGKVAGGDLSAGGEVGGLHNKEPLSFSINGKMKDVETRELIAAISTNSYLVRGQMSGAVQLSGVFRPWNTGELNGHVSFVGRKGEFRTAPRVLEVFSALKINSLLRRAGGKKDTGLPFDVFEASGPIRAGRYIMDRPLLLKNESFQLAYTGWMGVLFDQGKGTLLFNFLESTSHVVKAIPVVSSLVLGSDGELMPLVVDVEVMDGVTNVRPRSVKTLTGPLVNVVKNVFRFPFHFFPSKKTN